MTVCKSRICQEFGAYSLQVFATQDFSVDGPMQAARLVAIVQLPTLHRTRAVIDFDIYHVCVSKEERLLRHLLVRAGMISLPGDFG